MALPADWSCQALPGVQLSSLAQSLYGPPRHQGWATLKWRISTVTNDVVIVKWVWHSLGSSEKTTTLIWKSKTPVGTRGRSLFLHHLFLKRQVARTLTVWCIGYIRAIYTWGREQVAGFPGCITLWISQQLPTFSARPPTRILGTNAVRLFSLTVNNNDRSWAEKRRTNIHSRGNQMAS